MKARLKWVQYLGFIAVGAVSNMIGPLLPTIRPDLQINYSQGGLLLSGQFVGIMLTALIGGYLIDKFGSKPFLLFGSALLFLGLTGSMSAHSYLFLYIANLITGIGFGIYEVGINSLCADNSDDNKGDNMSFLHFFFGAGAISGPILAVISTKYFDSWRLCFGISAIMPLIVGGLLLSCKTSAKHTSKDVSSNDNGPNPLRNMFVWMLGLAVFIYVGIETSTGGWITEFWKAALPSSMISASLVPSIFWFSLTIGRLFAGKIADRIGLMKYLVAAASVTLLLAALWNIIPLGIGLLVVISLLGFALSGQFPTMMVVITSSFPGKTGMTSAFLTVFAGIGGFVIPSGIGKIADAYGIRILSLSILGFSCLLLLFMILVDRSLKKL